MYRQIITVRITEYDALFVLAVRPAKRINEPSAGFDMYGKLLLQQFFYFRLKNEIRHAIIDVTLTDERLGLYEFRQIRRRI